MTMLTIVASFSHRRLQSWTARTTLPDRDAGEDPATELHGSRPSGVAKKGFRVQGFGILLQRVRASGRLEIAAFSFLRVLGFWAF